MTAKITMRSGKEIDLPRASTAEVKDITGDSLLILALVEGDGFMALVNFTKFSALNEISRQVDENRLNRKWMESKDAVLYSAGEVIQLQEGAFIQAT